MYNIIPSGITFFLEKNDGFDDGDDVDDAKLTFARVIVTDHKKNLYSIYKLK